MYAKIINEHTKEVSIGLGTDTEFYKSIGMEEMEVERAYDGKWYIKGYTPNQPLDELKQAKLIELKSTRDSLEVAPIEYNGNFYDYDENSRDRIKDAQEALEGTELSIEWTTADNTDATLFYQDFKNIRRAVAMRADMLHKRYRQLRELIDTAQTVKEVEAIKWEEGVVE